MPPPPAGPLQRTAKNAGWLLGGKGVGAVLSLVYLGLAARTLGVAGFGLFALVLTYGQAVQNLTGFQSWQLVIQYGAKHLAEGRGDRLRRIAAFATLLDLGAAATGAVLAAVGVLIAAPLLGWDMDTARLAALFALSQLFAVRGSPTGLLRLFDRFDLAAYTETVLPAMRFAGALVAWAAGATVAGFLIAWAVAELVTTLAMWAAARRELRARGLWQGGLPALRGIAAEHPGLWRFAWTTNIAQSITAVWQQLPVLAVGGTVGAAAAGGYRIAAQLAGALAKPALSLTRAIYPEFAHLAAGGSALGPVLQRAVLLSAIGGAAMVALVALLGEPVLRLVFGEPYATAAPVLLLLTLSSALGLAGFALEPALVALGRPGWALAARATAGAVFAALIWPLLDRLGPDGAAWASLVATALAMGLLALALRRANPDAD